MKTKKNFLILSILFAGILAFSPYTITKLLTKAEDDVIIDDPQYQQSEQVLGELAEKQKALESRLEEINRREAVRVAQQETMVQNTPVSDVTPSYDAATAPGKANIKLLLADKTAPAFPVSIRFVGIGNNQKTVSVGTDGQAEAELVTGRYYGEIESRDPGYKLLGDGPAFFIGAGEEKELGVFYLVKK